MRHGGAIPVSPEGLPRYRYREIDYAGNCEAPIPLELHSRPDTRNHKYLVLPKEGYPMWIVATVRCRRCPTCLRKRAAHWRFRAIEETHAANRTWFGTLTFNPIARHLNLERCRVSLRKQGLDFDQLASDDRYAEQHREYCRDLTKFIKRVRKNSGAPLRYLLVAEAHKSGDPHYHILVHETSIESPITHRVLKAAWQDGFSDFKLASDLSQVTYCCKYLTKDARARVRASARYGNRENDLDHS